MHPAFVGEDDRIVPNILLHRFGASERYFLLKLGLGGQHIPLEPDRRERNQLQKQLSTEPLPFVSRANRVRLIRAQRNTTALFGAGLIDRIPDDVLHDLAKRQAGEGKVSGRVPPVGPDKVGRFGWRGQQERLHDFVLGACANELGLEVPRNSQPVDPLRPNYRPTGLDLSDEQCRSLTAFVASLPPPQVFKPRYPYERSSRDRGRELFDDRGLRRTAMSSESVRSMASTAIYCCTTWGLAWPIRSWPRRRWCIYADFHRSARTVCPSAPQPSSGMYYGGSSFQDLAVTGPPATSVEIKDPETGARNQYRRCPNQF